MDDVNEMYRSFEKHLFSSLRNFTDPIPGVLDTMKLLREEGIRIGSTTGYTQAMMEVVVPMRQLKAMWWITWLLRMMFPPGVLPRI